jgi:hypothetical protein
MSSSELPRPHSQLGDHEMQRDEPAAKTELPAPAGVEVMVRLLICFQPTRLGLCPEDPRSK